MVSQVVVGALASTRACDDSLREGLGDASEVGISADQLAVLATFSEILVSLDPSHNQ